MKYIRTKDEVIEINPTLTDEQIDISLGKDIPRADTIEELCDELMVRGEYSNYIIDINELDKDCDGWTKEVGIPKGIVEVYGAIWVIDNNGAPTLKSVAKANDKGELELL